jgi:PKD repeat protein
MDLRKILLFCLILITFFLFIPETIQAQTVKRSVNPTSISMQPLTTPRCNTFTFDANGSYDPDNESIAVHWDFGDGETSSSLVEEHTYKESGEYTVTLTITDNSGLECSLATVSQVVKANIQPTAAFTMPENVCINDQIKIDATESSAETNKPLSYVWDFGDNTGESGNARPVKVFTKGGDFKVTLTVDDNSNTPCSKSSAEQSIHVNAPPSARIGQKEILRCVTSGESSSIDFDASATTDPNNDKLTYEWDFGDGTTGEGIRVSHTYTQPNNYDVKLIVTDDSGLACSTSVDFTLVRINEAPRADAGEDTIACPNEEIVFDGTNSYISKKGTVIAKWLFGDGETAEGLKNTHIYKKPGKYQANLTLDNKLNSMCPPSRDTRNITINSAPTVTLKADPSVCIGNAVSFDATSALDPDGDDLEYYWSFGDGTILKDGPKVTHEYRQGGMYKVTVIVDDVRGTNCSTATASTTVKVNTPPVADAGPNATCCVNAEAVFDATASYDPDGDPLTYLWDFGDGTTAEGHTVSHAYTKSGEYRVLLTVDDNSGTSCSKATSGFKAISNSKPVPVMSIR